MEADARCGVQAETLSSPQAEVVVLRQFGKVLDMRLEDGELEAVEGVLFDGNQFVALALYEERGLDAGDA